MDNKEVIKTGDIILFSGYNNTGFIIKTFISSEWNHAGVAVRFIKNDKGIQKISLTEEGDLYVLETNTGVRKDAVFGYETEGVGFIESEKLFKKYNKISFRRLNEIFRTKEFAKNTLKFVEEYKNVPFPKTKIPFISVWLGISMNKTKEMFCSQILAHYYPYCIFPLYEKITDKKTDRNLSVLFGEQSPLTEDMFTPGTYMFRNTPDSIIFSGPEELIYVSNPNLFYIILQPLIVVIVILLFIWYSLPKT